MNQVLKSILLNVAKGAEQAAASAVPGGAMIDGAVHGIIEHKGDVQTNVLDAAEGAIKAVEEIKGAEIVNEVQFRAGVAVVESGLGMIRASLKVTAATA